MIILTGWRSGKPMALKAKSIIVMFNEEIDDKYVTHITHAETSTETGFIRVKETVEQVVEKMKEVLQ